MRLVFAALAVFDFLCPCLLVVLNIQVPAEISLS